MSLIKSCSRLERKKFKKLGKSKNLCSVELFFINSIFFFFSYSKVYIFLFLVFISFFPRRVRTIITLLNLIIHIFLIDTALVMTNTFIVSIQNKKNNFGQ